MISILLPTRKRFSYLKSSIESLVNTCTNKNNIEILLLFDDDDEDTIENFNSWNKDFKHETIITPRLGYKGMHTYNNMLAEKSNGNWLFLWNDDSRMVSKDWDALILEDYKNSFLLISPKNLNNEHYTSTRSMFPIFPKKWYEITGRISPYQQSDTYLNQVSYRLGIFKYEPRIFHEHGEIGITTENRIQDEVTKEIEYKAVVPFSEVIEDTNKLYEYLRKK